MPHAHACSCPLLMHMPSYMHRYFYFAQQRCSALQLLVELQLEHRAVIQRLDRPAVVVHPLHRAQRLAEALNLGLHQAQARRLRLGRGAVQ